MNQNGSMTNRRKIQEASRSKFAIFGNILVNNSNRDQKTLNKIDSMNYEDTFMLSVARFFTKEHSGMKGRTKFRQQAVKEKGSNKIEQLIQEHDSYGSNSSEELNSYSERETDQIKYNEDRNDDLKFYKHIMLNKFISKPMSNEF